VCGATSAQNNLQQEDLETLQEYNSAFQQQYANQQAIYGKVSSVLDPILAAGPNQQGFSTAEGNTLNSQAVEGTAENYAGAAKAVNEATAAEGGGNSPISVGGQTELKEEVANSAAQTESGEETQIQEQNYATGRQNFENAEEGEMAIASGENPLGYEGAATSQASVTGNEANAIASENNSWYNAALGAAGSIGSAVVNQNPADIFG
jgi:hypothetical protein